MNQDFLNSILSDKPHYRLKFTNGFQCKPFDSEVILLQSVPEISNNLQIKDKIYETKANSQSVGTVVPAVKLFYRF